MQERSRVLDLVCAAMPSGGVASAMATSRTPRVSGGRMTMSADQERGGGGLDSQLAIDPLGPYTPEADSALNEARDARDRFVVFIG